MHLTLKVVKAELNSLQVHIVIDVIETFLVRGRGLKYGNPLQTRSIL